MLHPPAQSPTLANRIDDMIASIVLGGYLDDLADDGIKLMARRLDPQVLIQTFLPTMAFTCFFSDGSAETFEQIS